MKIAVCDAARYSYVEFYEYCPIPAKLANPNPNPMVSRAEEHSHD